jgi:hypothetical protein
METNKLNDLKTVYELHKSMEDNQVIIAYEGEFNQIITQSVLSLAEKNLEQKQSLNKNREKE